MSVIRVCCFHADEAYVYSLLCRYISYHRVQKRLGRPIHLTLPITHMDPGVYVAPDTTSFKRVVDKANVRSKTLDGSTINAETYNVLSDFGREEVSQTLHAALYIQTYSLREKRVGMAFIIQANDNKYPTTFINSGSYIQCVSTY